MSSERVGRRLDDVVENIDAIGEYVRSSSFETYMADRRTRDATERCLERIIEAIVKIGADQMMAIDPTFPVSRARALGNMLRHAYVVIDEELIYNLVTRELPNRRAAAAAALST